MKIWSHRVSRDSDYAEATFADIAVVKGLRMSARTSLIDAWPSPVLKMIPPGVPVDSFSCGPIEIVSQHLKDVLSVYVPATSVEFLPVQIEAAERGFYAINPIGYVDALDRANSVYTEDCGVVDRIEKLAIDTSAVQGLHLFALDAIQWVWVVSDELAAEVIAQGLKGVAFEQPEAWTPY